MFRRSIQFLLLASFAFWASGSAAYLHELLEHSHAQPAVHAGVGISKPAKQGHSEDDCPICASLAAMHLSPIAPSVAVTSALLCVGSTPVINLTDPSSSTVSIPQSRGPPAKISSLQSA
jgi:hypothetical protein